MHSTLTSARHHLFYILLVGVIFAPVQSSAQPIYLNCLNDDLERRKRFPDSKLELTVDTAAPKITNASTGVHRDGVVRTRYDQARNITLTANRIAWQTGQTGLTWFWFLDRQTLKLSRSAQMGSGAVVSGSSDNILSTYSCSKIIPPKTLI